MKLRALTLGTAIAVISSQSFAGAPNFLDSRAMAMGGVGVAAARPAAASFFNPALLAVKQKSKADGFGLLLPSVYVAAIDEDELRDVVDDFEDDYLTPFEAAVDALGVSFSAANINEFNTRIDALDAELQEINGDNAIVDLGLGLSVQVPGETLGIGIFASSSARFNVSVDYRDSALLQSYRDAVKNLSSVPSYSDGDLQSGVRAIGAGTSQAGVSLAHNFSIGSRNYAVGVSPKVVDYRVYDYNADLEDFESDDLEDTEVNDTSFNFDLGLATYLDEREKWLFGLSVLNVLSQELKTADSIIPGTTPVTVKGLDLELKPTFTAGISYAGSDYIVAADLQLNKTDAIYTEDDRQMIGIGAEYDLFETAQFRLGARHNLEGDTDPVFTTGIGLTVFGASLELAALGNSDTLGASLQIGSTF